MPKIGKDMQKSKVTKPTQTEIENAREFVSSARGQLILGQALAIASKELREDQPSNSEDMDYIGRTLFSVFYHIYTDDYQKILKKAQETAVKASLEASANA